MLTLTRWAASAGAAVLLLVLGAAPALAHTGEEHGGTGLMTWLGTVGIGVAALGTVGWTTWRERRRSR